MNTEPPSEHHELDVHEPHMIPYDAELCDLFLAALATVLAMCQAQGALMGPEYGREYREMIAGVVREGRVSSATAKRLTASTAGTSHDLTQTAAAMRRAAHRPTSAAPPTWRAVR